MTDKKANRDRKSSSPVVLVVALMLVIWQPAYGYTDPGSGLLLWQMVGAAFVGSLFYVRRLFGWLSVGRKKSGKDDGER